ncbi:MAG: hypothetical protein RIR12_2618 [Bacteroidota bacterium]|jgi:hypothetical protein
MRLKPFLLFVFVCLVKFSEAQTPIFEPRDTTSVLPKGLYLSKGLIKVKKGYRIKPAIDSTIILVIHRASGGISGAYSCSCESGSGGSCKTEISGSNLQCKGGCGLFRGCKFIVTTENVTGALDLMPGERPGPKKGWKEFKTPPSILN